MMKHLLLALCFLSSFAFSSASHAQIIDEIIIIGYPETGNSFFFGHPREGTSGEPERIERQQHFTQPPSGISESEKKKQQCIQEMKVTQRQCTRWANDNYNTVFAKCTNIGLVATAAQIGGGSRLGIGLDFVYSQCVSRADHNYDVSINACNEVTSDFIETVCNNL